MAHLVLGNIVEARRDLEKAQELEPSKVTQEKVWRLQLGSKQLQILSLKRLDQLLERGKELCERKEWEAAESVYNVLRSKSRSNTLQSALQISAGFVAAKLGLGDVHMGQKKWQDAYMLAGYKQLLCKHT